MQKFSLINRCIVCWGSPIRASPRYRYFTTNQVIMPFKDNKKAHFFKVGLLIFTNFFKVSMNRKYQADQKHRMNNAHETCNERYQYQSHHP